MVMESRRKLARKISSKAKPTTGGAILRESSAMYEKTPKQIKRSADKKSKKPTSHDTQKVKKPKTPITKERGKGGKAQKKSKSIKVHVYFVIQFLKCENPHYLIRTNSTNLLGYHQSKILGNLNLQFATIIVTHMKRV